MCYPSRGTTSRAVQSHDVFALPSRILLALSATVQETNVGAGRGFLRCVYNLLANSRINSKSPASLAENSIFSMLGKYGAIKNPDVGISALGCSLNRHIVGFNWVGHPVSSLYL